MSILDPNSRRTYLEMLKPPLGYRFDCGIGTTYSVDLLAAMMVPLSLALLDADSGDAAHSPEPIALLEAMRRFSERIVLFHEPDRAIAGRAPSRLAPLLDNMLVPAFAPKANGIFHPKVWALRFTPTPASAAEGATTVYRLLVLSRNLTFDRSWDVALQLEGELLDRRRNIGANRPLRDFFSALPGMTSPARSLAENQRLVADTIANEIGRVDFKVPPPFDGESINFFPIGLSKRGDWPFDAEYSRLLVVSPFLQAPTLKALLETTANLHLISTVDSLDALPEAISTKMECWNIAPAIVQDNDEEGRTEQQIPTWDVHAKVYLGEHGRQSTLLLGSANATEAAFGANVEFMVGLKAKKSDLAIDSFFEQMKGIVEAYTHDTSREVSPEDALTIELKEDIEAIRRTISRLNWSAKASASQDGTFDVTVDFPDIPGVKFDCRLSLHLITRKDEKGALVSSNGTKSQSVVFSRCRLEDITTLWEMSLYVSTLGHDLVEAWVQMIPIDVPAGRDDAIVRSLVSSKTSFQKYLYFLLADPELNATEIARLLTWRTDGAADAEQTGRLFEIPLFEQLILALSDDPSKLDRIQALVQAVSGDPEGQMLPDGFKPVWDALWRARHAP